MMLFPVKGNLYRVYGNIIQKYVPGEVLEVLDEELTDSYYGTGQIVGTQRLRVRLNGTEEVELDNYLTDTHNVLARPGMKVIICADTPDNAEPYYTLYSYDRTFPILLITGLFVVILALVGRRRGIDSFLAILFTVVFILRVALPMIYNGISPVLVAIMTVLASTVVTLLFINGFTSQFLLGVGTTLMGALSACVLFALFAAIFHITGLQAANAESLLIAARETGLDVGELLIAGTVISSLGAVMDVSVSVLSALREVALVSAEPSRASLFKSGMNIGKDIIGTMSNTLIFAFAGGSLSSMLVFYSYGIQTNQLLHSDYVSLELCQGLCCTCAVIITVPLAAAVGAWFWGNAKHRDENATSNFNNGT